MTFEVEDKKVVDFVNLLHQFIETYSDDEDDEIDYKNRIDLANDLIKQAYKTNK